MWRIAELESWWIDPLTDSPIHQLLSALMFDGDTKAIQRVVVRREVHASVGNGQRRKVRERIDGVFARPQLLACHRVECVQDRVFRTLDAYVGLIESAFTVVRLANVFTGPEGEYDPVHDRR